MNGNGVVVNGVGVGGRVVGGEVGAVVGATVVGSRVLGAAVGVVVGAGDGADDGGHTSQTYRRRFEQSLLSKRAIPKSRVMLRDVVPC